MILGRSLGRGSNRVRRRLGGGFVFAGICHLSIPDLGKNQSQRVVLRVLGIDRQRCRRVELVVLWNPEEKLSLRILDAIF